MRLKPHIVRLQCFRTRRWRSDLHAHRFWLDVKALNVRAQALYASEGFVEEGRLRESVRLADGYESLIVMSLLDREYQARVALGVE
jgi:diamine N-acetyltransferase